MGDTKILKEAPCTDNHCNTMPFTVQQRAELNYIADFELKQIVLEMYERIADQNGSLDETKLAELNYLVEIANTWKNAYIEQRTVEEIVKNITDVANRRYELNTQQFEAVRNLSHKVINQLRDSVYGERNFTRIELGELIAWAEEATDINELEIIELLIMLGFIRLSTNTYRINIIPLIAIENLARQYIHATTTNIAINGN